MRSSGWFGKDKIDWLNSDYAQVVIIVLFLWKNLGYNMILFMSALSSIPKDILEVAVLESATPMQIFWHIKLRYLSSTILFVTIMSLINSFKVFREIYLLKGDYPYADDVYAPAFYEQYVQQAGLSENVCGGHHDGSCDGYHYRVSFSLPRIILERMWKDELKRRDPAELWSRRLKRRKKIRKYPSDDTDSVA